MTRPTLPSGAPPPASSTRPATTAPRRSSPVVSGEQLEAAADAYYTYCGAPWDDLAPQAQNLYRIRMQLALDAFAERMWRPIATVPRDGSAILLFLHMKNRGDYIWLDRWDHQDGRWRLAPHAKPTHWTPLPAPPHP
ncbi:hypothetical protein [Acetobacter conturbans]|uniref:hypothetical protein n=1 Tax=Acetobacter conturbans TaxID=1737472 RepID=UPI00156818B3|nr:hypothetical protein [Acetobacter conturbans]